MPKLIEIIGPPGSGKSHISEELEKLKISNKQIFFHSNKMKDYKNLKKLNLINNLILRIKVILFLFFYFSIFWRRLIYPKIYKNNSYLRMIFLFYKNLLSIEILKKVLSDDSILIMEPGPVMFFLQDYFYIYKDLKIKEMKIFNSKFIKLNYLICLNCNIKLLTKRLYNRKRGLPKRMKNIDNDKVDFVIHRSVEVINKYLSNIQSNFNIIKIDSSKNISDITLTLFDKIKKFKNN